MSFDENTYLSWYMPRAFCEREVINFHSSGVPELDPHELSAVAEDPWSMPSRFEASLAEWLNISPEEVVFSPGATGGNLLALLTLADPDSEVIVESPVYEPMLRQAARLCRITRFNRTYDEGWRLPVDRLYGLISGDTRLVLITEPHNPAALFSPRDDVLELASIAAKKGAVVLINEIYRGFTTRHSYHGTADNIVIVSSLSKLFGTYWLRLGWLSAPADTTERLRKAHINMSIPTMAAASLGLLVMEKATRLQEKARFAAGNGFPAVKKWVERTDGISWHEPHGTGFGCIKLPDGTDDVSFAERLFNDRDVLVVPGAKFEIPGTVRISWLQTGEALEEGLQRIGQALNE
jgi:aspartate/methionine/tyrosine aminotransferase